LQLHVLAQMRRPRFILADTMDLWINTARDALLKVIARVDMLTLNESEARHLTGCHNLVLAAKALLRRGPSYVLIKKGEHGSMLFSKESVFLLPAYPLEAFADPTGAGDTFAGGCMGCLAAQPRVTDRAIRRAMSYGTVMASFEVERFSLDGLLRLTPERIEARVAAFRAMCAV
jgi:sugar/nucleoside kinase (ribokinase family)